MRPADRTRITDELERMFDHVQRMSDAELVMLRVVWDGEDETARTLAWRQVKAVARSEHREDLLGEANSRLAAWVNNYLTATAVEYGNFLINAGSGMDAGELRRRALPPLMDAVAAIVGAGELDADQKDALLEPFNSVISGRAVP